VFRIVAIAAVTFVAGIGLGLTTDAGADQTRPAPTLTTKTPVSCLLALESAWKTINQTPPGIDHEAEFDASYLECLQAS
jgi:hypothetical protein